MPLGPVMCDLAGFELTAEEIQRLRHPLVGGVILFGRNYQSPEQLADLTAAIRSTRKELLIAVDHEGGRVQRFRDGFTRLPPMRALGSLWNSNPEKAKKRAQEIGYVLAAELLAHGVDFSFAPVLDIDFGTSGVIGDRAFHRDPAIIAELGIALQQGMNDAGMQTVGKHFPGHGFVRADSHHEIPVDEREFDAINRDDLMPFYKMARAGMAAVMPAHVIYPQVDAQPAGFSRVWLQDILRKQMQFDGVIFSDDLSMEGASVAGGVIARAEAALNAGCDMVLVCNAPDAADELLAGLHYKMPAKSAARLKRMKGREDAPDIDELGNRLAYQTRVAAVKKFVAGSKSRVA
jgi:beta-N-acetylhexosaminidase